MSPPSVGVTSPVVFPLEPGRCSDFFQCLPSFFTRESVKVELPGEVVALVLECLSEEPVAADDDLFAVEVDSAH